MRQDTLAADYHPKEVRRSFRLLSMDAIFYIFGLAFLDQSTVLPAFLSSLTDSSIAIGAIIAIRPAGLFLPQMWSAHYLRSRMRHKSYLIKVAAVSRVAIALFAGVMFIAGPLDRGLMLIAFIVMYAAFWLSEGAAGVSWTDIMAKTIPERMRGRLFGVQQFVGGILAIFAGILVSRMLGPDGPDYPRNYAVLSAAAAVFFAASLVSLSAVREPDGVVEDHDGGFMKYVRKIGSMLAGHAQLKRLLIIQVLLGFFGMSMPFYILYARDNIGITGTLIGIFLSVQMAGSIAASAVAGVTSDRYGPKPVILSTAFVGALASVVALLLGDSPAWAYGVLFFLVGWILGSGWIGLTNYLLEMAEPNERRSYIGLANTVNAPTILFPVLGGLMVQVISYQAVFAVTGLAVAASLVLTLGLHPDDRRSDH